MVAATALASLAPPVLAKKDDERFRAAMETLSASARNAYRALVYETPHFPEFFRQATPIREISGLKIGSRPASRTQSTRIEELRAIRTEERRIGKGYVSKRRSRLAPYH